MSLFIRFQGFEEAAQELRGLPERLEKRAIERLSQVAYDKAQGGAMKHGVTGALTQSLFNRAFEGGREVGHDTQRAPHAVFVLFGTRPHEIRPKRDLAAGNSKRKAALRWATRGGFAFARVVKHPGYVGDNYLFEAAETAIKEFASIVDAAMKEPPT